MPFRADTMDLTIPVRTPAGYLYPNPVASGDTINPNFGQVRAVIFQANSFYDALQVGITKRMSQGVQFQTSFTWGRAIDTDSATVAGDQFSNAISSLNWFDQSLTRGLADYNVSKLFVVSVTWQLPTAKSLTGPAAWLANGWQMGGILKLNDGVPFTPTWGTGGDPAGTNSADDYAFPDRLTGPGCANLSNPGNPDHYIKTQCFIVPVAPSLAFYNANCDPTFGTYPQCFNLRGNAGRNIIIGPGIANLDFSLFKNNYVRRISENFNIQFRAEFFNILNRPDFGDPVVPNGEADLFDATGAPNAAVGKFTTTSVPERQIQLALKIIW